MRSRLSVLMTVLAVLLALSACSGGAVPAAPTEAAPNTPVTIEPTPLPMPTEHVEASHLVPGAQDASAPFGC